MYTRRGAGHEECIPGGNVAELGARAAGAATFRAALEPEPELNFCWSEPGAGAALFKLAPAPAASLRQAKKKSLVLVSNMTLRAV